MKSEQAEEDMRGERVESKSAEEDTRGERGSIANVRQSHLAK